MTQFVEVVMTMPRSQTLRFSKSKWPNPKGQREEKRHTKVPSCAILCHTIPGPGLCHEVPQDGDGHGQRASGSGPGVVLCST